MLRGFATAVFCGYFTFVGFPIFFDLISDRPAPAPSVTAMSGQPRIYGRVRPVSSSEASAAFATVERIPPSAPKSLVYREVPKIGPAFDPDLYRSGRVGEPLSPDEICEVVEEVAGEHAIPAPLFARLIWQESGFRNEVVSRAGAQGIAQFMPGTAAERGLEDPFDPLQALPASAGFLRELTKRFGNFGLAAAAYNGGPERVKKWLSGRARLPKETRDYVLRITGRDAEYWAKAQRARPRADVLAMQACEVKAIRAAMEAAPRSRR
jgi:hypothetical protein